MAQLTIKDGSEIVSSFWVPDGYPTASYNFPENTLDESKVYLVEYVLDNGTCSASTNVVIDKKCPEPETIQYRLNVSHTPECKGSFEDTTQHTFIFSLYCPQKKGQMLGAEISANANCYSPAAQLVLNSSYSCDGYPMDTGFATKTHYYSTDTVNFMGYEVFDSAGYIQKTTIVYASDIIIPLTNGKTCSPFWSFCTNTSNVNVNNRPCSDGDVFNFNDGTMTVTYQ